MLKGLKVRFFTQTLHRTLRESRRRRVVYTLHNAKTVALLFDATSAKAREVLLEFAKKLEKNGTKVRVLGYFAEKNAATSTAFNNFSVSELSWRLVPKSEKALQFIQEKADLLVCYNPDEQLPLMWIAAASPATMKVGTSSQWPNDFDLQLEIPKGSGPAFFLDQLAVYLAKLVIPKYDATRAL